MAQNTRSIKVKQLQGPELTFSVNPDIGIAELKGLIQQQTQMAPNTQRLIYKAKPMLDTAKLSDHGKCK